MRLYLNVPKQEKKSLLALAGFNLAGRHSHLNRSLTKSRSHEHYMSRLCLIVFLFSTVCAYANIDLETAINDIHYRGRHELVGRTNMTLLDNDFAGASVERPIFIELRLLQETRLGDTLVNLADGNPTTSQPLYLAMKLISANKFLVMAAPADALSVVRWVVGETSIWLKVQSDSSSWVVDASGQPVSLDADTRITWTLGINARTSAEENHLTRSNLIFNTRSLLPDAEAASVNMCLDTSQSSLTLSNIGARQTQEFRAYGPNAETGHGQYAPSAPLPITFSGDSIMGRGVNQGVDMVVRENLEQVSISPEEEGFLRISGVLSLELADLEGSEYRDLDLYDGAFLSLQVSGNAGFTQDAIAFINSCSYQGTASVVPDSAHTIEDRVVYQEAIIMWAGGQRDLDRFSLEIQAQLIVPEDQLNAVPLIEWTLWLPNRGDPRDEAPYNGLDQMRLCLPSVLDAGSARWYPSGPPERSRSLPHITNPDGNFSTQILLANPDPEPRGYMITGYNIDGNGIGVLTGSLDASQRLTIAATQLFDVPSLSHLAITAGTRVRFGAVYKANGENKAPVHIFETPARAFSWRVNPGFAGLTYDGLALINLGQVPTDVYLTEVAPSGKIISQITIFEGLPPKAKLLHILGAANQGAPRSESQSYFEIAASQPTAIVAIRGDLDSNLVWENPAISFEEED